MPAQNEQRLYVAASLADAASALIDRGLSGAPLAGATWIMRALLRQERQVLSYVAISKVDELQGVAINHDEISVGACVTHSQLAREPALISDCGALAIAAANSANPAVREVATIGGNLCAGDFAAADLVPALICLDAKLELHTPRGPERMEVERFLQMRANVEPGSLVRRIIIPRALRRSVHVRLPLRKAGDYPVAIVSFAAALDAGGVVKSARVAVGSVEPTARRWKRLETELTGRPLDPALAAEKAEGHCEEFQGRDGIEAPGWYRIKVLPYLVRKAVQALQQQAAPSRL